MRIPAATLLLFLSGSGILFAQVDVLSKLTLGAESVVRVDNYVQGVAKTSSGKLRVMRYASTGGGFVLDDSGLIGTCAHVLKGKGTVRVTLRSGKQIPAQLVAKDEKIDFALLKVQGNKPFKTLPFSTGAGVKVHDKIFTIGVYVDDKLMGQGNGPSKQVGEQKAAEEALGKYKK